MTEVSRNNEIIEHGKEQSNVATINKNGYVSLPYSEEDFKSFITGLLGRGQEIERKIWGRFDINLNDIVNINTILNQRILQQNKASLVSFSSKIFYSDESAVTLHSIEELQTYSEIRPVVCRAIHLSWDYLIKFEDKDVPEKQQINIFLNVGDTNRKYRNGSNLIFNTSLEGIIRIGINHTARTWAVDIDSILKQYFENLIDRKKTFKDVLSTYSGTIASLIGACFFAVIIAITIFTTNQFSAETVAEVSKYVNQTNISTDDRIKHISNYIAEGSWTKYTQAMVMFIILGAILSGILIFSLDSILSDIIPGYSFLTINQATEKYKEDLLKDSKKVYYKLFSTIILGIITGIIANYIFRYLTI